jgi:hypothetical protein
MPVQRYPAGITGAEPGRDLGAGEADLRAPRGLGMILQRQGVEMRRRDLSPEQVDDAVRFYEAGLSLTRIGIQMSVDHAAAWHRLRRTRGTDAGYPWARTPEPYTIEVLRIARVAPQSCPIVGKTALPS